MKKAMSSGFHGMFDDYNNTKSEMEATFSPKDEKPWQKYQDTGVMKPDPQSKDAPAGIYMEPTIKEPPKSAEGRSEWYMVRNGGTKMKRLHKNNVLTERSVSIVRALPEDIARMDAAMERMVSGAEPVPRERIKGTFVAYDPPRLDLGETLNKLGDDMAATVPVSAILDEATGEWRVPSAASTAGPAPN